MPEARIYNQLRLLHCLAERLPFPLGRGGNSYPGRHHPLLTVSTSEEGTKPSAAKILALPIWDNFVRLMRRVMLSCLASSVLHMPSQGTRAEISRVCSRIWRGLFSIVLEK
jgi:hypothetical protein